MIVSSKSICYAQPKQTTTRHCKDLLAPRVASSHLKGPTRIDARLKNAYLNLAFIGAGQDSHTILVIRRNEFSLKLGF